MNIESKNVYSVTIDPTTVTCSSVADMSSSLGDYSSETFRVNAYRDADGTFRTFGLIKFDVSSIPANAIISSAAMSLYITSISGLVSTKQTVIQLCTSTWRETYTAQNPTVDTTYNVTMSTISAAGLHTDNITNIVSSWVSGTKVNYGIRLYPSSSLTLDTSYRFDIAARENTSNPTPSISVTYSLPGAANGNMDFTQLQSTAQFTSPTVSTTRNGAMLFTPVEGQGSTLPWGISSGLCGNMAFTPVNATGQIITMAFSGIRYGSLSLSKISASSQFVIPTISASRSGLMTMPQFSMAADALRFVICVGQDGNLVLAAMDSSNELLPFALYGKASGNITIPGISADLNIILPDLSGVIAGIPGSKEIYHDIEFIHALAHDMEFEYISEIDLEFIKEMFSEAEFTHDMMLDLEFMRR